VSHFSVAPPSLKAGLQTLSICPSIQAGSSPVRESFRIGIGANEG
jgi:hypothetical protein